MYDDQKIMIRALEREHARLQRAADKAKREADEAATIGSEFFAIHQEFDEIIKSKDHGPHIVKRLEALQKRRDRANKILKKDLAKLFDKETEARFAADDAARLLANEKWRLEIRTNRN